ncbi:helix-turn-helix domain-containing protein [Aquisalinus flavus]|nr:helix-turn-helix domain-containing protein [Aquisalinus flavus]MBD0426172.1 helix-turn-helix domain-containing protein [Aquisalinus flavus]UNE48251.1 helix-turn-helix domain-containing protein [Aquisalinus flavus]
MSDTAKPHSFDPARQSFAPYGLTCVRWQPSVMTRPDHHNEIEVNFLTSGSVSYLIGGRKFIAEAGRLCAFWASIPHQITHYTDDCAYLVATIPLPDFLSWRLREDFVQGLLKGEVFVEPNAQSAPLDLLQMERWVVDLGGEISELHETVLLEMRSRLARLALGVSTGAGRIYLSGLPDGGMNKVEAMACFIAQHYGDALTVQDVADHVGLHPNYAMTLFQKAFGATLVRYLTHFRVSHAQRLLITTDLSITDIALASGFNSISRFNEAFHQLSGVSPRAYRKQNGGSVTATRGPSRS